jgi:hypothetical protein
MARRARGSRRGRRRGPVDHTFTGASATYLIGFTQRFRPPGGQPRDELSAPPGGPGLANRRLAAGRTAADEPARDGRGREATHPEPSVGPPPRSAGFRPTSRAGRDHRCDPGARAGRHRARRDGDPRPDERPAPAIEGALGGAGSRSMSAASASSRGLRFAAPCGWRGARASRRGRGPRNPVERLAAAFERELGVRRDAVPEGGGQRHGAVVTCWSSRGPRPGRPPRTCRRSSPRSSGGPGRGRWRGGRRRAAHLPPRERPRWDAVFLPGARGGHLRSPGDRARSSPRSVACSTSDHECRGATCGCRGRRPDRRIRARGPTQPIAVPRRAPADRPGAARAVGAATDRGGGRLPKVDQQIDRRSPTRSVLAHGPCPGRRRRSVHRLPRRRSSHRRRRAHRGAARRDGRQLDRRREIVSSSARVDGPDPKLAALGRQEARPVRRRLQA